MFGKDLETQKALSSLRQDCLSPPAQSYFQFFVPMALFMAMASFTDFALPSAYV